MRNIVSLLALLCFVQSLHAHHGPGIRGYDPNQSLEISGVITKCVACSNGSKSHGVVQIRVDSVIWEVTLPDTPPLRKAKVNLNKLKPGIAIKVTGFAHQSAANKIYATEITTNGVKILWVELPVSTR